MGESAAGSTAGRAGTSRAGRLVLWLAVCARVAAQGPGPQLPVFTDVTQTSGVEFRNASSGTSQKYLLESMVGGVAAFDYNGDGLLDLYFVNGAELRDPMPPGSMPDKSDPRFWNRLYRNEGGWRFTECHRAGRRQGRPLRPGRGCCRL